MGGLSIVRTEADDEAASVVRCLEDAVDRAGSEPMASVSILLLTRDGRNFIHTFTSADRLWLVGALVAAQHDVLGDI